MMQKINIDFPLNPQQLKERQHLVATLKADKRILYFLKENHLDASVVEDKAQMLASYLEQLSLCEGCLGLSMCKQKQCGHVLSLNVDPLWTWELRKCRYQKAQDEARSSQAAFSHLEVSEHFLEARLETLNEGIDDVQYLSSLKPIVDWLKAPSHQGFYLYGHPGVGKTHLVMAIANHFAQNHKRIAMIHMPSFAAKYPSSYFESEEKDKYIASLLRADVLILDDIGAETYSSYFRDEVLFPLLNLRMDQKKLTFFSSNHSLESLAHHYRFNQKGDDEALKSTRILERIKSLAKAIAIQGQNRRG
jgi:primosomal protein DnaI